jgi:hypothetical protein
MFPLEYAFQFARMMVLFKRQLVLFSQPWKLAKEVRGSALRDDL